MNKMNILDYTVRKEILLNGDWRDKLPVIMAAEAIPPRAKICIDYDPAVDETSVIFQYREIKGVEL